MSSGDVHHGCKYMHALMHPFDHEAEGAQVPDEYSFPTATSFVRQTFVVTPDGNGNIDFVVQPNLFGTIAYYIGATNGISGGFVQSSTSGSSVSGGGFSELGIVTQADIQAKYSRYRVVGMGVRLKVLVNPLSQQGQLTTTMVPSLSHMVWYPTIVANQTAGGPSWYDYLQYYELPPQDDSGYITQQILGMPMSHMNMVSNIQLDGGLDVPLKVVSPQALHWRDGNNANIAFCNNEKVAYFAGGQYYSSGGPYVVNATSGYLCQGAGEPALSYFNPPLSTGTTLPNPVDEDFVHQGGWSVLCFRGSGLPPSVATFSVEVCVHIEGVPHIAGGSALSFANATLPPVIPGLFGEAIQAAKAMPTFRKVNNAYTQGKHHVGEIRRHVSQIVRTGSSLYRDLGPLMGAGVAVGEAGSLGAPMLALAGVGNHGSMSKAEAQLKHLFHSGSHLHHSLRHLF